MNTRRQLWKTIGALATLGVLDRCSGAGNPVSNTQILAYANAAVNAIPGLLIGIQNLAPKVIPKGGPVDVEIINITASLKTSLSTLSPNRSEEHTSNSSHEIPSRMPSSA